jgi:uncharacterized protein YecE (DUF72 family)
MRVAQSIPMTGRLYLGTSGFAFPQWKGVFYPPDIKPRQMLAFYASVFSSVEINYSFRRDLSESTVAAWRDATPQGFLITLKAHQRITHWFRLSEGADGALRDFLEAAGRLGDRLGVILFQCPPNLKHDQALIESFLSRLPQGFRYAFEFRHPSWTEAREALAARRVAWVVADTEKEPFAEELLPPGPFVYLRLRKEHYPEDEIEAWAGRIRPVLDDGRDVFCYFKHEDKEDGPIHAERLRAILSRSP